MKKPVPPVELGNVKVVHPNEKRPIYLELAKIVKRKELTFVTGYECTAQCEAKGVGLTLRLIQYGEGVKVIKRECDKKYAWYHDAGEIKI